MKDTTTSRQPSFKEAVKFWFRLGWISFGGTAGHIALMHDFLVDRKKWISNSRFFHALSLCMLLPGPEAQQLSIYIGWQLHGKKGGLIAGTLFVLPSMLILLGLSIIYVSFGHLPWIYAMFNGLKPAVIAIICIALYKVGHKSLHRLLHFLVAGAAFAGIFFFNISLLTIIMATIALALVLRKINPALLHGESTMQQQEHMDEQEYYINNISQLPGKGFSVQRLIKQLLIFLLLWFLPLLSFYLLTGQFPFWSKLILFFTQTAFFTLGGSYTVLPYVAQFAVSQLHWLSKSQMVDGFALAETTPGPLIIVVGFVGFMAGFHHFHASLLMGSIALMATVYYTFLPCFLFIFAGGPLIEKTHGNEMISGVLGLVAPAVVGVILNLTLFLGKDVVFPTGVLSIAHIDLFALAGILVSFILLATFRWNVIYVILISLVLGLVRYQYFHN